MKDVPYIRHFLIENIVGDEDDRWLYEECLSKALQKAIYDNLLTTGSKTDPVQSIFNQLQDIFKTQLPEVKDPKIECRMGDGSKVYSSFRVPQWLAEQMKEEGMLDLE